jgi:diaminopimelate decarboxylase
MIHLGADMFIRECYLPDEWSHEILVADQTGKIKTGPPFNKYMLAGPLCFQGDILAGNIELPEIGEGDFIVICDTGGYTLSMWSRYNSRQMPKVIGFSSDGSYFEILKERENPEDLWEFWS